MLSTQEVITEHMQDIDDREDVDIQTDIETEADGDVSDEDELQAEVERLTQLAADEHDGHLRAVAEMQNFRRRSAREQVERTQFANQELLARIVPIMDNLDRALEHRDDAGGDEFARGVEMVTQQLREALASFGVEPVAGVGAAFDPQVHEAVAQVETDEVAEGTVVAVDTPGYCLHDRCLCPAKVIVAKAPQR